MPFTPGNLVSRAPALTGAGALLAWYVATLAPGVTLWDSGEFLAAIHSLGVPHPPGTPLFVLAARAWATLWSPLLDFTVAINLASAVATAVGCALVASVVACRAGPLAVFLGTVVAGLGSSVWSSATETEVYGWALLLMGVMLRAAEPAGREWSARHRLLLCWCFGLAVPLHLSALVAGPATIVLASSDAAGDVSWRVMARLGAAWLLAMAIGTVSWTPAVLGALLAGGAALGGGDRGKGQLLPIALTAAGASLVLVMLWLAQRDPFVNQGDPSTWTRLWEVVGRRQYDVPGVWPRRAPFWLQVGNVAQYADWQFGKGWSSAVGASWMRTPFTMALVALSVVGSARHRATDPRTWRAALVWCLATSLGVVVILNLRAGPSYGWGILPDGALREARERDYFFIPLFVLWGTWVAWGLAGLLRGRHAWLVAGGAIVVVGASNVGSVNRRSVIPGGIASAVGQVLLSAAPERAVLLVAGDNDAYASWYHQEVRGERRDVTTVVVPLLPALWYRAELARRHGLLPDSLVATWHSTGAVVAAIASSARSQGRPVAATAAVPSATRSAAFGRGRFLGHLYVEGPAFLAGDPQQVAQAQALVDRLLPSVHAADLDPAEEYLLRLLRCPEAWITRQAGGATAGAGLLETTCNYR